MSVLIIVSYLLVGGHWRVDNAVQSAPTQAMYCTDRVAKIRTRAAQIVRPRTKVDVFCQRQPADV